MYCIYFLIHTLQDTTGDSEVLIGRLSPPQFEFKWRCSSSPCHCMSEVYPNILTFMSWKVTCVLPFKWKVWSKCNENYHIKFVWSFPTVLYKLVLASATFNLVHADKTIVADHPIKCCRAAYSCGTVYFAAQGDCNPFFTYICGKPVYVAIQHY